VVLNGTASSGKTSLAGALQATAPTTWVVMAQDDFAQSLVPRWVAVINNDGVRGAGFNFVRDSRDAMHLEVGPVGATLLRGYRHAVGAVARAGNDVVVDEATFDDAAHEDWESAIAGLPNLWVRVDCDLDVCERRERARHDRGRLKGLARGLYDQVHEGVTYDITVSTTHASPEACARTILDALPD
jgi:chloramphenicol 3-O phosphotransferase